MVNGQNGFILPIDGGELYELKKLVVNIGEVQYGGYSVSNTNPKIIVQNFELDLTSRCLISDEWNIKNITNDFPAYKVLGMWSQRIGLRENRGANIFWERGKDYIDFSKEQGTWFQKTLIDTTVREALAEYFTINSPLSVYPDNTIDLNSGFQFTDENESWLYKNISFNVEYTTLKKHCG